MNPGQKTLGRPFSRLLIASAIAATLPAYANDASEIEKLKAQIEELDQKLKILGRKQELVNEDLAAKQKAAPTVTASDRGFGFKSQDGQFEYRFRGIIHADYREFGGDAFPTANDGFLARRVRPTFEGTVFGKYGFRFTPEFAESGDGSSTSAPNQNRSRVVDAYLDIRHDPSFQIRIGKFKPFVGLERLQSASDIKFIERSYVSNNFLPNRDFGISVFGDVLGKRLNYAVGVFNGVRDGGDISTAQDANSKKTYAARVFATPFIESDSVLKGLGVGIAGTSGNVDALPTYRSGGFQNTVFTYNGASTNGTQTRLSPQAYFYHGPLGLMYEYAEVSQPIRNAGSTVTTKPKNSAWHLTASWLLTGEDASFRGVKPFSRFQSGPEGGWGAFEVVARLQENQIDRNLPATFQSGQYALGAKSSAIGLNWYLNESSKVALNYEVTELVGGTLDSTTERFAAARYQLSF
ncbi:MAG: OprO/OprP family phosphate-selective porin [Oxalobacteraceae bacterium]|nr:OprO/OprP family phosphate-selective porin [Oxalobacteraceae bacterium]